MTECRVQLDVFSGPLDLLLYLIRRDELDIHDIPVARVAEQYVHYVHMLEQLDPSAAGEFLVLAATLVELKSRALLPTPPLDAGDDSDDPRALLVRQLLEYKRFKDAAKALGAAADERSRRYTRRPAELPPELIGVELEEVQLWDLVAAFGRVMSAVGQGPGVHQVTVDNRPIEWYQDAILMAVRGRGATTFHELFGLRRTRLELVCTLLALLELIRLQKVRAEQDRNCGVIYLLPLVALDDEPELEPDGAAPPGSNAAYHDASNGQELGDDLDR